MYISKWKKPDTKIHILYNSIYMTFKKGGNEMNNNKLAQWFLRVGGEKRAHDKWTAQENTLN